jgi:hypothetical protein
VVEHLPSKCKALDSSRSTSKWKKRHMALGVHICAVRLEGHLWPWEQDVIHLMHAWFYPEGPLAFVSCLEKPPPPSLSLSQMPLCLTETEAGLQVAMRRSLLGTFI